MKYKNGIRIGTSMSMRGYVLREYERVCYESMKRYIYVGFFQEQQCNETV